MENAWRIQECSYRDIDEYVAARGLPDLWPQSGLYRMLVTKDTSFFCYFQRARQLEDKHLSRVKVFTYEEGAPDPVPLASTFPMWR